MDGAPVPLLGDITVLGLKPTTIASSGDEDGMSVETPMQRRNGLHGLRIRSRVMACCRSHGYAHPYEAE